MRVRRLEVEWDGGKATVDMRSESGSPLPIVGIVGGNGSGKTLLQTMALRLFRKAMYHNTCFLDWDKVSGYGEFEYGSAIATGVVKQGKIVQSLVFPDTVMKDRQVLGGLLMYNLKSVTRSMLSVTEDSGIGSDLVYTVLSDLYKGEIRNSVIWVDSFDMGLDDFSAREFLRVLIKKSLERDNQLIVSTARRELLSGIGEDSIRQLGAGTNVVERVLKSLR
jgi:ABC-type ATPase with predicted acetyltransferase domain